MEQGKCHIAKGELKNLGEETDFLLNRGLVGGNSKENKDLGAFPVCHWYGMLLGKRKAGP